MYIIHKYTFNFWLSYFKYESQNRQKIDIPYLCSTANGTKKRAKRRRFAKTLPKVANPATKIIRKHKYGKLKISEKSEKNLKTLGSSREKMQKFVIKSQNPIHLWDFVYVS